MTWGHIFFTLFISLFSSYLYNRSLEKKIDTLLKQVNGLRKDYADLEVKMFRLYDAYEAEYHD